MGSLLFKISNLWIFIRVLTVADELEKCVVENDLINGFICYYSNSSDFLQTNQTVANYNSVQYGCHAGYTLVGSNVAFCLNGKWRMPQPTCELQCSPRDITSPTFTANCYLGIDGRKHRTRYWEPAKPGTIAQITCKYGYESGSITENTVVCRPDGHWHPTPKPCEQICGEEGPEGISYIISGSVTNVTKAPWNVGIYHQNGRDFHQICGGTIVSARFVISAMHCFWNWAGDGPSDIAEYRVIAGKYFRAMETRETEQTQTRHIVRLRYMAQYNIQRLYEYDIAVLVLNKHFEFYPHISPACLDHGTDIIVSGTITAGSLGNVVGWGLETSNGQPSPVLKFVQLPVIAKEQCIAESSSNFIPYITDDKFCAGYLTGCGVCQGDSGAGLMFERIVNGIKRFYLKGIVSIGPRKDGSCDNGKYAMFTNVTNFKELIQLHETDYQPVNGVIISENSSINISEAQSKSCTLFEIPKNGLVTLSNNPSNVLQLNDVIGNLQRIQYSCLRNQTLIGSSINICFDGQWTNSIPLCGSASFTLRGCQINAELKNGIIDSGHRPFERLVSGNTINSGSMIIYHCLDDFLMVGHDVNFCLNGEWKHDLPQCEPLCPINVLTKNTLLIRDYNCFLNGTDIPCSDKVRMGTSVKINDYDDDVVDLKGDFHEATCETDSTWTPNLNVNFPSCGRIPKEIVASLNNKIDMIWNVFILTSKKQRFYPPCFGSILTQRVILSHLSCFGSYQDNNHNFSNYWVVVGNVHKSENSIIENSYQVLYIKYNESYLLADITESYAAKITLVILKESIVFNDHVAPICLYGGRNYDHVLQSQSIGFTPQHVLTIHGDTSKSSIPIKLGSKRECQNHTNLNQQYNIDSGTSEEAPGLTCAFDARPDNPNNIHDCYYGNGMLGGGLIFEDSVGGQSRFYLHSILKDTGCYTTVIDIKYHLSWIVSEIKQIDKNEY